jgi:hypothetical protein
MKPTKTVNLDNIYVKKPCIGEELSGRVNIIDTKINELSSQISGLVFDNLLESTDLVDEDEDNANS